MASRPLPTEVLEKIFSYVDLKTIISCSATCKRFFDITAKQITEQSYAVWPTDKVQEGERSLRKYAKVRISKQCQSESIRSVCEYYDASGEHVRMLHMHQMEASAADLVGILSRWRSVSVLDLKTVRFAADSEEETSEPLVGTVKELVAVNVDSVCPHFCGLERVRIRDFRRRNSQNIPLLLRRNASSLKQLKLEYGGRMCFDALDDLTALETLELRALYLDVVDLDNLLSKCVSVKKLHFNDLDMLQPSIIATMVEACTQLEELTITNCDRFMQDPHTQLHQITSLRKLRLQSEYMDIDYLAVTFRERFPNLEELSVDFMQSYELLAQDKLTSAMRNMPNLRKLSITRGTIDPRAFGDMATSLRKLHTLDLDDVHVLTTPKAWQFPADWPVFRALRSIRIYNWHDPRFYNTGMSLFIKAPQLRELQIRINTFPEFVACYPKIEKLDIFCRTVDKEQAKALVDALPALRQLNLNRTDSITENIIESVVAGFNRVLAASTFHNFSAKTVNYDVNRVLEEMREDLEDIRARTELQNRVRSRIRSQLNI